jgi:gamma-tubulin complex component 3
VEVKRSVSTHLLDIVIRQQGLPRHLAAIKRFLLLGQGDFVRVLLDAAQPELDKSAKDVSQYTLQVRLRQGGAAAPRRGGMR